MFADGSLQTSDEVSKNGDADLDLHDEDTKKDKDGFSIAVNDYKNCTLITFLRKRTTYFQWKMLLYKFNALGFFLGGGGG